MHVFMHEWRNPISNTIIPESNFLLDVNTDCSKPHFNISYTSLCANAEKAIITKRIASKKITKADFAWTAAPYETTVRLETELIISQ
jgi:hypothetical protein